MGGDSKSITRRQAVAIGAAGVAGGAASAAAMANAGGTPGSRLGGIHIHVKASLSNPSPPIPGWREQTEHTFVATLWGPDDALAGMGTGWTEGDAAQRLVGTGIFGCIFSALAKIEGDVLKGVGVMVYSSGDADEKMGPDFPIEANLSTGFCRFNDMNMGYGTQLTAEGVGTVTRI